MLDHIGFTVADISASRRFYDLTLAPLGMAVMMEVTEEMSGGHGAHLGYGTPDNPFFWIGNNGTPSTGLHVAFVAPDRATVDAVYRAARAAGGRDNGAPGLRPHYHASYYGAFVLDPDGNNIEAVCHKDDPA